MSLTKLITSVIGVSLLAGCISSSPIKNESNINKSRGKSMLIQTYSTKEIITIASDTNQDGKWDIREYYQIMDAEQNWGLFRLIAIQEDTNQDGKFEMYEFVWPEGVGDKIEKYLKEKIEEKNSTNDFYY